MKVLEIRLCGGLLLRVNGAPVPDALLAGRQGRLVFAYLAVERHRAVPREELADLLWPSTMPSSWTTSLSAVISRLRKMLNEIGLDGVDTLASPPGAYQLFLPEEASIDWDEALTGIAAAEAAVEAGDSARALELAATAGVIAARGFLSDDCPWVDRQRDAARDVQIRALLARGTAYLQASSPARAVDVGRDALALDPMREASFRLLMRALARAGERAEALRVWERCRATLVDELGVDPSPETEAVYLDVLGAASFAEPATAPPATTTALPSGVITFLLTDIVESSVLWEREAEAMAVALERHDALVAETVRKCGGALLKSKLEGDATVSVFTRATSGMHAALLLRDAFRDEPWPTAASPRVRMALHTGEAYERDGDYFGPALNRAARLRSLAGPDQIFLSQAVAELVRDHVPDDAVLLDRGHRDLRGLSRGENVYELGARGTGERVDEPGELTAFTIPALPSALVPVGPFVGRDGELAELSSEWELSLSGNARAVLVGGEPGVGKSRLVAEAARLAHGNGALVLYGRCDEELGVPYQPFVEAVRLAAPALGNRRLREVRGVDNLARMVPELGELVPDATSATRADPETERYALFGAVTQLLVTASAEAPVLLVLDDLHWAGKTTLALLRHVLRDADNARLLVLATYRDTELSRTHPLASTIADLRGDGVARRVTLSGLPVNDVVAYLAAVGHDDRALGRELAKVTSGNPFFLIEALRHVEETGGSWKPGSLPEGVKEATGRRLSRLSDDASAALSTAAVVGSTFSLEVVETLQQTDLVEEMGEACRAGLIIEDADRPGTFRFAHALVRQVLLAELVTVKRVRMHRSIAELLESRVSEHDPDAFLTDLAYHWFECASSGAADKAVAACMRAAEHAIDRLAYEEAADLFGMAIEAAEATDVDANMVANLHLERCDALLTAGEVTLARGALEGLRRVARSSPRLSAWHTTFAGQLAVFAEPDRLVEVVDGVGEAAQTMRDVQDVAGEAKARYVYALALERLGRIGEAEKALDAALAAARSADDRHLADAILAEVPLAVLWGPSPVTRASGRCLDVVRVCRITAGAAAVESVALRCQAVLEALRGRTDAARRMIGSARRTAEQLGLAHHRLETDVSAGLIELLAAEWANAETVLQSAYDELRERGLDGEAARAGGLLGRALLMQRRTEEAEIIALEAEQLAGADVRANIIYRGVLAEAAARRGDSDTALELARGAVELASATDALLPLADARLSLASVLNIIGDTNAADAEAHRAEAVCEAKGATVLAEAARAASRARGERTVPPAEPALTGVHATYENEAVRMLRLGLDLLASDNYEGYVAFYADDLVAEDHRSLPRLEMDLRLTLDTVRILKENGFTFGLEVLATRGEGLALTRLVLTNPTEAIQFLVPVRLVGTQFVWAALYDDEDFDAALLDLDRQYVATEGAHSPETVIAFNTFIGGVTTLSWEEVLPQLSDDFTFRDFKSASGAPVTAGELGPIWADFPRTGRGGRNVRVAHILDASPSALLAVLSVTGDVSADGGPFEEHTVEVMAFDGERISSFDAYHERDLDVARRRFDELTGPVLTNTAVRQTLAAVAAQNLGDHDGVTATFEPGFRVDDRREFVGGDFDGGPFSDYIVQGGGKVTVTVLEIRADHVMLGQFAWRDEAGTEVDLLAILRTGDSGRLDLTVWFDPDDRAAAEAELDRLGGVAQQFDDRFANATVRTIRSLAAALNANDRDGVLTSFEPTYVVDDRRLVEGFIPAEVLGREVDALLRDSATVTFEVVATRGERFALTMARFDMDGAEVPILNVLQTNDHNRFVKSIWFDEDAREAAYAALDELCAEIDPAALPHAAWAALNERRLDEVLSYASADYVARDHRTGALMAADEFGDIARTLVAYDRLAPDIRVLVNHEYKHPRARLTASKIFGTMEGGRFEIETIIVHELDRLGRFIEQDTFSSDQAAEAWARFDELTVEKPDPMARFENAAFAVPDPDNDAFNRRDWDALAASFSANVVQVDHRPTRLGTLQGRDRVVDSQRVLVDFAPDTKLRIHHEQRIGNYLLNVSSMLGTQDGGSFESNVVTVQTFDASGRVARREVFDTATQAEEAFALFDALTAVPPAPPGRFENTAHRASLALLSANADVTSASSIATRGDHLVVGHANVRSDGADKAMWYIVEATPENPVGELDWIETRDEAYAVLDERYMASNPTALYLRREAHDATILGGDWNALGVFYAVDVVLEDHRPGRHGIRYGRRTLISLARSLADAASGLRFRNHHFIDDSNVALISSSRIGRTDAGPFEHKIWGVVQHNDAGEITYWDIYDHSQQDEAWTRYDELVAAREPVPFANTAWHVVRRRNARLLGTRSDRLMLISETDGSGVEFLVVVEIDESDEVVFTARFDIDDLEGAYRVLNERYVETLAEPMRRRAINLLRGVEGYEAGHLYRLIELAREDFVGEFHGPLNAGVLDFAGLGEWVKQMDVIAPGGRTDIEHILEFGPEALFGTYAVRGEAETGAYEILQVGVLEYASDDKVINAHYYDPDQIDDARAKYDELTAAAHRDPFENAAAHETGGDLVATRGERLALKRTGNVLTLTDLDAEHATSFDADGLDSALEELDRRFLSQLDDGTRPIAKAFMDAYGSYDLEAFAEHTADGLVVQDHRKNGFGQLTREEWIQAGDNLQRIAIDGRLCFDHIIEVNPHATLAVLAMRGGHESGAFELRVLLAAGFTEGKATEAHVFDLDQLDEARAQYGEIYARAMAEPFANLATQRVDELAIAWNSGNWARVEKLIPETESFNDDRAFTHLGDLNALAQLKTFWDVSRSHLRREPIIATRGEHLALIDAAWQFDLTATKSGDWNSMSEVGANEMHIAAIFGVDQDGNYTHGSVFDVEDLTPAYERLDALYIESLDEAHAATFRRFKAFFAAAMQADLTDDLRLLCTDDVVGHDHRQFYEGVLVDLDRWIATIGDVRSAAPDVAIHLDHVVGLAPNEAAMVVRFTGTMDGGPLEMSIIQHIRFATDGRAKLIDGYDVDQVDEVRRQFKL